MMNLRPISNEFKTWDPNPWLEETPKQRLFQKKEKKKILEKNVIKE